MTHVPPGILAVAKPCSVVVNVKELFHAESTTQVYAHLHELIQSPVMQDIGMVTCSYFQLISSKCYELFKYLYECYEISLISGCLKSISFSAGDFVIIAVVEIQIVSSFIYSSRLQYFYLVIRRERV